MSTPPSLARTVLYLSPSCVVTAGAPVSTRSALDQVSKVGWVVSWWGWMGRKQASVASDWTGPRILGEAQQGTSAHISLAALLWQRARVCPEATQDELVACLEHLLGEDEVLKPFLGPIEMCTWHIPAACTICMSPQQGIVQLPSSCQDARMMGFLTNCSIVPARSISWWLFNAQAEERYVDHLMDFICEFVSQAADDAAWELLEVLLQVPKTCR